MYRHADEPFESEHSSAPHGRDFSALPLAVATALIALAAEFFAIFLLGWGMAPTSVGCGAGRVIAVSVSAVAISVVILALTATAGLVALGESGHENARPRRYLVALTAIYTAGSIPLLILAGLLGSCLEL